MEKLSAALANLKIGISWDEGVTIAPLPEIEYIVNSNYNRQVSIFGRDTDAIANSIDPYSKHS
jgi:hypothetical protein